MACDFNEMFGLWCTLYNAWDLWNDVHDISCGYKLDWYDCMISACETNEMVGVKVAWYWHEMEFTTMVWEWWMGMIYQENEGGETIKSWCDM